MFTPGLYLVTPDMADADALAAAVAAVLPARPALVQYRNKLADARQRREQAARLLALCRGAGEPRRARAMLRNKDTATSIAASPPKRPSSRPSRNEKAAARCRATRKMTCSRDGLTSTTIIARLPAPR